ncbi:hypothetical protein K474DRAFT_1661475 [Panus rudis PR-1116 ss-1]|nr:hypothetical protein K474DRAFT_1661475 [Panus rudis PR-1116 ss-1]
MSPRRRKMNNSEKHTDYDTSSTDAPRDDFESPPSHTFTHLAIFTLIASVIAYFYGIPFNLLHLGANKLSVHTPTESVLSKLPDVYALCTKESGKIYTVSDKEDVPSTVDCLLVKKGIIEVSGSFEDVSASWDEYQNEMIRKFYGNEPKAKKPLEIFYTKPGSIVVPGLTDSHAHLIEYAKSQELPLEDSTSLDDLLDKIESYLQRNPNADDDDTWILGTGWDQTKWKGWKGGFPTAADLVSRDSLAHRLIALTRVDGHALWVSPRVLDVTKDSLPGGRWPRDEDVVGGEIKRDERGLPNGIFIDNAMGLVPIPPPTPERLESYAYFAMQKAAEVGLTNVHDASSMPPNVIEVYKNLADDGRMPIRVYAMASPRLSDDKVTSEQLHDYGVDGRLNVRSVKIFTDGALGSWGAALIEPYSDDPNTSGIMRIGEDELEHIVRKWWEAGWGINIHCIGDRANKVVLDIYEKVLTDADNESIPAVVADTRRPRIEHAQIMRVDDLERAGKLGVIASVQPTHATSDMWYAETRLGPERIKGAYAYQTLLNKSAKNVLPLGSDFPVEGINPILGFYAAVTRLDKKGDSPHGSGGWYPEEKLTRSQALKGMTLDAAYASFAEDDLGSLVPGKKADFVVLDRDIMDEGAVPDDDLLQTKVLATIVDGQAVFGGL